MRWEPFITNVKNTFMSNVKKILLLIWKRLLLQIWMGLLFKQWPLAGEFVEFEYSPKICQFWRIWVLAKMAILENRSDSIHSPTLASLLCPDLIHLPDIRQPVSPDWIHSPDIRQPFSTDSIHSRKANLATFRRI